MLGFLFDGYSFAQVLFFGVVMITIKVYLAHSVVLCKSKNRIDGKTVIITGANAGIGKQTALDLARRGGRIILACRNVDKAAKARDEIIEKSQNKNIVVRHLDLASLHSVRKFAENILKSEQQIDILINNAGCMELDLKWTGDGLEYQMQSNHFGHFLLTVLLLDALKKSDRCRIINVSSKVHALCRSLDVTNLNFKGVNPKFMEVYNANKLCNILFTKELARRIDPTGRRITVNVLHPGVIATQFSRFLHPIIRFLYDTFQSLFYKTPEQGAQTTIHLAVSDQVQNTTGEYFRDCKIATPSKLARDEDLARKLWEASEVAVRLQPEERCL